MPVTLSTLPPGHARPEEATQDRKLFLYTDKEIARSLAIALTTVKSHVRSILDNLGVDSRTQAVVHVLRYNMLSPDELRVA